MDSGIVGCKGLVDRESSIRVCHDIVHPLLKGEVGMDQLGVRRSVRCGNRSREGGEAKDEEKLDHGGRREAKVDVAGMIGMLEVVCVV